MTTPTVTTYHPLRRESDPSPVGPCQHPGCDRPGTVDPARWHGRLCAEHGAVAEFVGRGIVPALRKVKGEAAA